MAKALSSWKVFPHPPLVQLEDNLWRVEQRLPNAPIWRVMAVAQMKNGDLVLHNGIALEEAAMKTLEDAGKPAYLLVPNGYHRLDARIFKDRYPAIRVFAPRGARSKVEEVVPVEGTYEQFPGDDTVRLETLAGTGEQEGVLIVRSSGSTTLVFNDAIFNMQHQPGVKGLLLRLLKSSGGPSISRLSRLLMIKDASAFREHLLRLADLPDLKRILVAHHEMISSDVAATLRCLATSI